MERTDGADIAQLIAGAMQRALHRRDQDIGRLRSALTALLEQPGTPQGAAAAAARQALAGTGGRVSGRRDGLDGAACSATPLLPGRRCRDSPGVRGGEARMTARSALVAGPTLPRSTLAAATPRGR